MTEEQQQRAKIHRAIRFGIRGKLIVIFVLIKVLPLVALALFAASQIRGLGITVQEKYAEMAGDTRELVGQIGGLASESSISALDRKARENIERLTTDTARSVAAFLYERDSDILLAAQLPLAANDFQHFLAVRTGRVTLHRPWVLNKAGDAWVGPPDELDKNPLVGFQVVDNKKDFHYRRPARQEVVSIRPLYHEITFVNLQGQEELKISTTGLLSPARKNVAKKENTWCRAETYFAELEKLKAGEIYVSEMIGPYLSSPVAGLYTKKTATAKGIVFAPGKAAYAGKENPVGKRFQGIIRWGTPVFRQGKKIGYVTLALDHTHIMEFTDHLVPTEERYSPISDAGSGNYAFMWDYQGRNISHPRDYFITGYDPETGDPAVPWLSAEMYALWQKSGLSYRDFTKTAPRFSSQSLQKKAAKELTEAGMLGLDCRYLNFAPQCTDWHNLTQYGGSGSFVIFWSNLWKLNTAAAIPYFTGLYGNSGRGFGYVTIGANVDEFHSSATETANRIDSLTQGYIDRMTRKYQETRSLMTSLMASTTRNLTISTGIMILIVLCIAVWMASTLTGKITAMIEGIRRFQRGELDNRLAFDSNDEMGELAQALNDMSDTIGGTMRDIREARDRAEDSDRAKSAFLANMSHEIRTPMNAIIGMSRLAHEASENGQQRRLLESVRTAADSLLSVVNDILDFSKIEAGQLTLDLQPFHLQELITSTITSMRILAREKNLDIVVEIGADVPLLVRGDSQRLRQILFNLLGNAIKFTEKGRVSLSVQNRGQRGENREIFFVIKDTGVGISKEHRELIFNSFSQVDNSASRKYQGTGLGLSISRKLCQLMGGDILVESEPGVGSAFSFFILFADTGAQEGVEVEENTVPGELLGRSLRILLVEDNETNRDLGRMVLENMGHAVFMAINGLEALSFLAVEDVDVILMDIQMPVMDGYVATQTIRALEQHEIPSADLSPQLRHGLKARLAGGHLNIIALTAHAMTGDRQKCLAAGMDEYLAKPFIPEQVAATLARTCTAGPGNRQEEKDLAREEPEARQDDITQRITNHLQQLYGLTDDKAKILLTTTSKTIRGDMARMERAFREINLQEAGDAAHSLKGLLLNLGLQTQAGMAEKIERASGGPDARPDLPSLEELRRGLAVLLELDNGKE